MVRQKLNRCYGNTPLRGENPKRGAAAPLLGHGKGFLREGGMTPLPLNGSFAHFSSHWEKWVAEGENNTRTRFPHTARPKASPMQGEVSPQATEGLSQEGAVYTSACYGGTAAEIGTKNTLLAYFLNAAKAHPISPANNPPSPDNTPPA